MAHTVATCSGRDMELADMDLGSGEASPMLQGSLDLEELDLLHAAARAALGTLHCLAGSLVRPAVDLPGHLHLPHLRLRVPGESDPRRLTARPEATHHLQLATVSLHCQLLEATTTDKVLCSVLTANHLPPPMPVISANL